MSGAKKPCPARLTSRQADIIRILISTGREPVTVSTIAGKLGFSSRTVLRELPDIERWFGENGISFSRKPGTGISIEEDEERLRSIKGMIDSERVLRSYSRKDRRRQLLGELLMAKEPVKSYVFQNRFGVSEGTLSTDLDALSEWLSEYGIKVVRRQGVGVLLEGSETAYRKAIAGAAFEFLDEGEILEMLRNPEEEETPPVTESADKRLLSFIEPETVTFIENILRETETKLSIQYTDSGYMALVVHLSLAVRRLRGGERIELDEEELDELKALPEYQVALKIAERIGSEFKVPIPEAEAGFITMHLRSARIWRHRGENNVESMSTREMVTVLVKSVERQVGLPFHTSPRLMDDLVSHMDLLLDRLAVKQNLDTMQNATQTEMLRQNYPEIYKAVEKNKAFFKSKLGTDSFPPSEITFVAMHFAAAAELLQAEQRRVAVAVVCPSGMGASRMLAANLTRSCPELEVRQVASALRITPEQLEEDRIDLVISTVPIQIDFPFICVKPVPQAQDMVRISQAVESVNRNRKKGKSASEAPALRMNRVKLEAVTRLGTEITEALNNFRIKDIQRAYRKNDIIWYAADMFSETEALKQEIISDITKRESIKSTYISDMRIYLLHCCTGAVKHCRIGFLRLINKAKTLDGTVEGAMVMLSPEADWTEGVEVIGHISMLLVEEKRFLEALKRGSGKEAEKYAENALVKYYESEIRRKTGENNL